MEDTRKERNLFHGDNLKSKYAHIIYAKLMSREWFSYHDLYASFKEKYPTENSGEFSKEPNKAFKEIRELLPEGAVQSIGTNRDKQFHYEGTEDDPLAELIHWKAIQDLKEYWQFCQDSAGFFPTSWLEHFFAGTMDLLDIRNKKESEEQALVSSADHLQKNIELLPLLYEAIVGRKTLKLTYEPFEEPAKELTFHPHLLKEFNGRWHLIGHADGEEPEWGYDLALDRIVGIPEKRFMPKYRPAPKGFYAERFKDVIGMSTSIKELDEQACDVRVRAYNKYMFGLTETKKLHDSQVTVVPFGEHEDGTYGEFLLHIIVNNEFIGQVMQKGDGLEVMSPPEVREVFRLRALKLAERYEKG